MYTAATLLQTHSTQRNHKHMHTELKHRHCLAKVEEKDVSINIRLNVTIIRFQALFDMRVHKLQQ